MRGMSPLTAEAKDGIESVVEKLRSLPAERVAEVEYFIDFLRARVDRQLVETAARTSEAAFAKVWDNADDAEYDQL